RPVPSAHHRRRRRGRPPPAPRWRCPRWCRERSGTWSLSVVLVPDVQAVSAHAEAREQIRFDAVEFRRDRRVRRLPARGRHLLGRLHGGGQIGEALAGRGGELLRLRILRVALLDLRERLLRTRDAGTEPGTVTGERTQFLDR